MRPWLITVFISLSTLSFTLTPSAQANPQCDANCQTQVRTLIGQLEVLKNQLDRQQASKNRAQHATSSANKRAKTRKSHRAKSYQYTQRKRPAAKRYSSRSRNSRLTPQQQMLLLQQMQQQQMMFNMFSAAQRNHATMLSDNMRIFTARQACYIAGNCRVRVEPKPY